MNCGNEVTVGRLTRTWHGYRSGDDESPLLTLGVNSILGRAEMVPAGFDPWDYYVVRIEGTPSVELGITFKGSLARDERLVVPGDRESEPGYYGVVATLLRAVPRVVRPDLGILGPVRPELQWSPTRMRCGRVAAANSGWREVIPE